MRMRAVSPGPKSASAALIIIALAAGCTHGAARTPERVRIAGSDTMAVLTRAWAERFMEANPGVAVLASGGGTAEGIRALVGGGVDVAAASRPLAPAEVEALHARSGRLGVGFRCALDGLSIYLHPDNPVRSLTLLQVKGIFTGRIGTWTKVGGTDAPIEAYTRQPSSGTYRFFQELVLDDEPYSERATAMPTTAAIVDAVRADPHAIGYGGLGYGADVRHCAVEGVAPSAATVRDGSYPLARYLYLYTARPPAGAVKRFIDWALSPAGQRVVAEVGYVPLWSE
jgi:phosphate transport system substrate-binding protein